METHILTAVVCGVLMLCGLVLSEPSAESITYQVEVVDHREEFSVQATTYFSQKHQAYRYDFSGGMSKLFIYPKEGKAYYYYPASDFPSKQFNITECYTIDSPVLQDLPSPLPSVNSFTDLGPDHLYDVPAEKYILNGAGYTIEIWVETKDAKTGIHPIRKVVREWLLSETGRKIDLSQHTTTEYYGFVVGEQESSVWDRPDVACEHDSSVKQLIADMAMDICVLQELIQPNTDTSFSSGLLATTKQYKTGRRAPRAEIQNDPLLLNFPWSPAQYESIAKTLPKTFDWRDFGAVTQVKNQRQCGSCWAHGAVGSVEGAYFLKYNQLATLSEQAMTDCSGTVISSAGTNGCFGGFEPSGFTWINQTGGIPPTEEYSPYQETNGYCRITDQTKLVAQLEGYYHIPSNTDALKVALVKLGPIVVGIDAGPLQNGVYRNGIIEDCDSQDIDHSVLLVGYGQSAEHGPYWIIKNSWDTTWGIEGYFLLSAKGNCLGILDEAYFPVLK